MAFGEPMFVSTIDPETNTVVLGLEHELLRNGMRVKGVNLMKYAELKPDMEALTKIRYKDDGALATLNQVGDDVFVEFHANVKGIAPGQSAVFYEGNDLLGGGIIQSGSIN